MGAYFVIAMFILKNMFLYYLGSINDVAVVSPNGESFGKFMNIKPYAMIFTIKPNTITAGRLNPFELALLSKVFWPKILNIKPPTEV